MQLKKSYNIATNICSRKSASTFGDLPDWIGANDLGFTQLPTHKYRGRQLMESILDEPLFITYMNVSGFFSISCAILVINIVSYSDNEISFSSA